MSGSGAEKADGVCCANCGVAEVDEVKLKDCDGCDLVLCGSDKCMEDHREQHSVACQKRAQELHDNELFRQPDDTHGGECPLCFLPMPLDPSKTTFYSCCSKYICDGCVYANYKSGSFNCPFCREQAACDDEEFDKRMMGRVNANDPAALSYMGRRRKDKGDHDSAVKYWTKAAELGDPEAHNSLAAMYWKGEGVEKDEEKAVYHLEKAVIGGHAMARHSLGSIEWRNGNIERAVKHFIIAANLGHEKSMKELWKHYKRGSISKEDLEATLRTHKAAIDAMKSPQREVAAAWRKRGSPLPEVVTAQRGYV